MYLSPITLPQFADVLDGLNVQSNTASPSMLTITGTHPELGAVALHQETTRGMEAMIVSTGLPLASWLALPEAARSRGKRKIMDAGYAALKDVHRDPRATGKEPDFI